VFDGRRAFGCEDNSDSSDAQQQQGQHAAGDSHVLMGVTSQARVGLLTLFEWYRYVEVRSSKGLGVQSQECCHLLA
jgi:hypothetical protein